MTAAAAWRGRVHRSAQGHGQRHARGQRGRGVPPARLPDTQSEQDVRRRWDEALKQAVDLLEGEARRRATGIRREVWYAGEVVGEESVYSDTLLIFLLKAHRPAKFRDNVKMEHSGGMEVTGRPQGHVRVRPACRAARPDARRARSRGAARPHTGGAHSRGSRGRSKGGTMSMTIEQVLGLNNRAVFFSYGINEGPLPTRHPVSRALRRVDRQR